jgi:hypothetical protein
MGDLIHYFIPRDLMPSSYTGNSEKFFSSLEIKLSLRLE